MRGPKSTLPLIKGVPYIHQAGAIIDYDGESEGVPSENLALIPDSDSKGKSAPKASVEE